MYSNPAVTPVETAKLILDGASKGFNKEPLQNHAGLVPQADVLRDRSIAKLQEDVNIFDLGIAKTLKLPTEELKQILLEDVLKQFGSPTID